MAEGTRLNKLVLAKNIDPILRLPGSAIALNGGIGPFVLKQRAAQVFKVVP